MQEDKQKKIDKINELVAGYKDGEDGNAQILLSIFKPFLLKQCNKYNQFYPGVHQWTNIEQEAMIIFYDLLNEYTIGGVAYFNVFIVKKLPFRLRYFFIKEIKHRTKNLCHEEEQFSQYDIADIDILDNMLTDMEDKEHLSMIKELIESDLLNDREREMLMLNMNGKSHEEIAKGYGISRSRVTKIVGNVIKKIKKEISDYYEFSGRK